MDRSLVHEVDVGVNAPLGALVDRHEENQKHLKHELTDEIIEALPVKVPKAENLAKKVTFLILVRKKTTRM